MNLENQASNKMSMATLEQLSALIDDELDEDGLAQLLAEMPEMDGVTASGAASLHSYLLIGEAMRGPLAVQAVPIHTDPQAFWAHLQSRIDQEAPLVATPNQPQIGEVKVPDLTVASRPAAVQEAANHSVFRWKMVAGLASVAAVAMVGWNSISLLSSSGADKGGQQLASAVLAPTSSQGLVQMPVTVGQNATIMLRDPRLDELMAARGQIGGTANLQMPASFLRNATFNAEKKTGGCAEKSSRLC